MGRLDGDVEQRLASGPAFLQFGVRQANLFHCVAPAQ